MPTSTRYASPKASDRRVKGRWCYLYRAIDSQGAGQHERVLISTDGSHTREHVNDPHSPLRNMIVAIVDEPEKKTASLS